MSICWSLTMDTSLPYEIRQSEYGGLGMNNSVQLFYSIGILFIISACLLPWNFKFSWALVLQYYSCWGKWWHSVCWICLRNIFEEFESVVVLCVVECGRYVEASEVCLCAPSQLLGAKEECYRFQRVGMVTVVDRVNRQPPWLSGSWFQIKYLLRTRCASTVTSTWQTSVLVLTATT